MARKDAWYDNIARKKESVGGKSELKVGELEIGFSGSLMFRGTNAFSNPCFEINHKTHPFAHHVLMLTKINHHLSPAVHTSCR